mmetsp:Transcript_105695/g.268552  ORF Transcript_105695/g.268552 Transcript_105695/m.268552 type:complete len:249 (-) Transcript_105695:248-994(-)
MVRVCRAHHDGDATLQGPAQGDLRHRNAVGPGSLCDGRLAKHRAFRAAEGRPSLQLDAALLAEVEHGLIVHARVPLHLVQVDGLSGHLQGVLQVGDVVVRHADGLDHADPLQLLHGPPSVLQGLLAGRNIRTIWRHALRGLAPEAANRLHGEGEVHQEQVDVLDALGAELPQHLQVVVRALDGGLVADRAGALGGDEDLLSGNAAGAECLPHCDLRAVVVGAVDVSAADVKPIVDGEASVLLGASVIS